MTLRFSSLLTILLIIVFDFKSMEIKYKKRTRFWNDIHTYISYLITQTSI